MVSRVIGTSGIPKVGSEVGNSPSSPTVGTVIPCVTVRIVSNAMATNGPGTALLIRGADSWASDPVADGRAAVFQNARSITIPKAGHWVHHDRFEDFVRLVEDFVD